VAGESSRGSVGIYMVGVVSVARGVAFLGWRCELSAALGVAASVAKWFGRDGCVFRALARETVRSAASWVG
jgi:hypothetical protein